MDEADLFRSFSSCGADDRIKLIDESEPSICNRSAHPMLGFTHDPEVARYSQLRLLLSLDQLLEQMPMAAWILFLFVAE